MSKIFVRLSLVFIFACCSILFLQFSLISFPVILPIAENMLNRTMIANSNDASISLAKEAEKIGPNRALPHIFIANFQAAKDKSISPAVINEVMKSYEISKFDADASKYRLGFVYANWDKMPQNIKLLANEEASMYASLGYGQKFLNDLKSGIKSPDADFSIFMAIERGKAIQAANKGQSQNSELKSQ